LKFTAKNAGPGTTRPLGAGRIEGHQGDVGHRQSVEQQVGVDEEMSTGSARRADPLAAQVAGLLDCAIGAHDHAVVADRAGDGRQDGEVVPLQAGEHDRRIGHGGEVHFACKQPLEPDATDREVQHPQRQPFGREVAQLLGDQHRQRVGTVGHGQRQRPAAGACGRRLRRTLGRGGGRSGGRSGAGAWPGREHRPGAKQGTGGKQPAS
jgi:hypothetical protein